jgi:guanylate kinase
MAIFLITAPSGAGKTTIAQRIAKDGDWVECVSHTTRKKRDGEVQGETYYFVSKQTFEKSYTDGEFAERVEYDGNTYGISKAEIELKTKSGKHVFIIVENDGYKQIKEQYPDAVGIFLHMSKEDCMANMLIRGDKLEKALERITLYDDEMKNRDEYDYVIKNVRNKQTETERIIKAIIFQYNKGGFIIDSPGISINMENKPHIRGVHEIIKPNNTISSSYPNY